MSAFPGSVQSAITISTVFVTQTLNPTETPVISTLTQTPSVTNSPTSMPPEILDAKGLSMIFVPSGEFIMGSEKPYNNAKPIHQVYLNDFYIDVYEVTNAQYKSCVDAGECSPPYDFSAYNNPNYYSNSEFDNFPVLYVNWFQAVSYCNWREARLPTEAEWEKSARGPESWEYPWGNNFSYVDVSLYANGYSTHGTVAVGSYENGKSAYGLYDMAGNVREWVSSLYMPYPYVFDDGREDLESSDSRGVRGGSWNYTGDRILTTYKRYALSPTMRPRLVSVVPRMHHNAPT
ncbi:MAG: SUMF1/EgtB/PvdO family nonheme iron enzyme [Anaerolineales bacterium]|uniref:formylglycine-generating enzyme family protein n=1 Tax=Candidatus Villigracilis vicinus TaxID=3140679 RepID=UPI0031373F02|nr:SUMF1/EgtB/PvdO family nonheme iron enzyme [Anaerolineales bacterium]